MLKEKSKLNLAGYYTYENVIKPENEDIITTFDASHVVDYFYTIIQNRI